MGQGCILHPSGFCWVTNRVGARAGGCGLTGSSPSQILTRASCRCTAPSAYLRGQAERRVSAAWNPAGGLELGFPALFKDKPSHRGNTETLTMRLRFTQCGRPVASGSSSPRGSRACRARRLRTGDSQQHRPCWRLVGPAGSCLCHRSPSVRPVNLGGSGTRLWGSGK